MFFRRRIENPHLFAKHLPKGMTATSLDAAAEGVAKQFGKPEQSTRDDGIVALHHSLEDRDIWFYRDDTGLFAIKTTPKPRFQAFFRPCSGISGTLTAIGTVKGIILVLPFLSKAAEVLAMVNGAKLLPGACGGACTAPCFCLPIGPYLSGFAITPAAGILAVWVTCTVSIDLMCV